jgi:tetratricopeptide (TPR) repeat protein
MTLDIGAIERQANLLAEADRLEEAEALVRAPLASGRGPIPLWRMLAQILWRLGRIEEAKSIFEMLVEANPGDLSLRFTLSECLLLLGDYGRGWREYHYRYKLPHTQRIERKVQRPRWDGRAAPGRTLLIHDEQGYGDTFQFLRWLPWAKERSQCHIVLQINPDSLPLAARARGFDEIVPHGALPPFFDLHCEMMSLPMVMGFDLAQLPGPIPYLWPESNRLDHWRCRLGDYERPRVALVWAGRPTHHNDANRSMSLADLAPLACAGGTLLSIQKGPRAEEALTSPDMPIVSLSREIRDFEDTAAILSTVDLLISVDSSPVHLAGALGQPAWVMLPFVPDWRWLRNRSDTPWYPTLRLFRQNSRGDWRSVVEEVSRALTEFRQ